VFRFFPRFPLLCLPEILKNSPQCYVWCFSRLIEAFHQVSLLDLARPNSFFLTSPMQSLSEPRLIPPLGYQGSVTLFQTPPSPTSCCYGVVGVRIFLEFVPTLGLSDPSPYLHFTHTLSNHKLFFVVLESYFCIFASP